ncbi:MAG: LysM peptidoglycan-binding domain-containing protein [Chloroflexi bacterium]|nr:LysM peptidoglycan-binding domain-containing protein [Chloroflexota bacterium]
MSIQTSRFALRGFVALLLLSALLLAAGVAGAAVTAQNPPPTPVDVFCVTGSVFDHAEKPSSGWTITAVMYDPTTGLLDPGTAVDAETINVDNDPAGPLGSFRFNGLAAGVWNFSIGTRTGWSPITPASFDVTLAYGRTDCAAIRFKMRQDVTVTVIKINTDHTPLSNWVIHAKPGVGNFFAQAKDATTDSSGSATFTLTPGQWTFSESAPVGVSAVPISPETGSQSFTVEAPGPYTIRFKNRVLEQPKGCIEAIKTDSPPQGAGVGLGGWSISVLRADNSIAAEGKTDAFGRIVFKDLPLGPYTVHEKLPATDWEAAAPAHYAVTLTDAACVTVEFANRQVEPAFCIVGRKVDTNGLVGLPGWEITAQPQAVGGYEPGPVYTDGLGYFRFDFPMNDYRIPSAEYNICETITDGWLAHTPTCQKVKLPTTPGACVALGFNFENQQVGHAESQKGVPPAGCSATHTVKWGESLYGIGRQYGKSAQEMLNANQWVRGQKNMYLYVGQQVCIP